MTSHVGRLYALAIALVVFFVTWATVAARPWVATTRSAAPQLQALSAREQQLRHQSLVVRRVVAHRWAVYRVQLQRRQAQNAARTRGAQLAAAPAPSVRVVTLPPLTITRTS